MDMVLSIVMLAALVLIGGAVFQLRRGGRKQAGLMLVLAAVMIVNVLIWTVPDSGGTAPIDRAAEGPR